MKKSYALKRLSNRVLRFKLFKQHGLVDTCSMRRRMCIPRAIPSVYTDLHNIDWLGTLLEYPSIGRHGRF